ncbi:Qat anti-phage system TatD family nuclease QatD [Bradyrhizobium sp. CCBAU 21360]|uniref:Qat anti-phage system TatD family nuclease QatD n=1 Tax=Bradyrhizobium sp. CCBAU 21360 TaxID=1325081 RepID=UPI0023057521|nr:Qat anti-phage system TatD family nuclease QatD [Bradyrhizobium sp. CCBAU 21360]MDA9448258.1 hydrolase TatD [Bradyrhizobium sp. CCBAU 21360]
MRLVDFHCHLDLYPDFEALVAECDQLGIFTLAVTTTPKAWSRNNKLASSTKYVRAALGMHPQLVAERWREIDLWERLLGETRYVGEVGLDAGPRYFSSLDRQTEVFRRILRCCAQAGGKILSIHSVRAATKVLDLIEEEVPDGRAKFVFHWFTGTAADARRAVNIGCYFSINSQMLQTDRGRALVSSLPIDRLLTETDGPFTSQGDGPARPRDVGQTVRHLATARGLSSAESAAVVLRNLKILTA